MSNPWSRAEPADWPYGADGASGDNFSGLADGAAKCVGVLSPGTISQPWADIIIPPWKITFASAPTAATLFTRYLLFSEDGSLWPGNISPTSSSDQETALAALLAYDTAAATYALLDQLTLSASVTTYYTRWHSLRGLIGQVPTYCTIVCRNQSGVALATYSSSNQITTYATETYA